MSKGEDFDAGTSAGTAGTSGPESIDAYGGIDALGYLQSVYRDPLQPTGVKMKAAEIALPFESPKLAVTALVNGEQFGDALEKCIKRSAKALEYTGPTIEHNPEPEERNRGENNNA